MTRKQVYKINERYKRVGFFRHLFGAVFWYVIAALVFVAIVITIKWPEWMIAG